MAANPTDRDGPAFHLSLPFHQALRDARTVLIAGAGGGADVFAGLPLFSELTAAGKTVHVANLSFAAIFDSTAEVLGPALVRVTASTETSARYFPELQLARWLADRGFDTPVYAIDRVGAAPVAEAYRTIREIVQPDAIVLIDGGTDSLMRGDEAGLGTPEEDAASIAAVAELDVPTKLLVCIGFGIDAFHGVCHAHVLEAVAALARTGDYLGCWSLVNGMPGVEAYADAVDYAFGGVSRQPSIVNASILSAIDGQFGDHHATRRTHGSTLFINPLMALCWAFRLDAVAARNLYLPHVRGTRTEFDLRLAIERFRLSLPQTRPWTPLPM